MVYCPSCAAEEGTAFKLHGKACAKLKVARYRAAFAAVCSLTLPLFLTPSAVAQSDSTDSLPSPSVRHSTRGEYLARTALGFRGRRYRSGGTGGRGFDCSGLAQTVCRKWGLMLPRTSTEQFRKGTHVSKADLQPGDLVFFGRSGVSHVGIFIGEGKFVHAANHRKGVIVSKLSESYYANRFAGARRLDLSKLPPTAHEESATE